MTSFASLSYEQRSRHQCFQRRRDLALGGGTWQPEVCSEGVSMQGRAAGPLPLCLWGSHHQHPSAETHALAERLAPGMQKRLPSDNTSLKLLHIVDNRILATARTRRRYFVACASPPPMLLSLALPPRREPPSPRSDTPPLQRETVMQYGRRRPQRAVVAVLEQRRSEWAICDVGQGKPCSNNLVPSSARAAK